MHYLPYFLVCESPLHVGTGTESSDYIDNRIQRDVVTEYPKIEGSSFRGALREAFERLTSDAGFVKSAFGPAPEDTEMQKGALKLSSLQLLLFPVASPRGTHAWATCARALNSLRQEFALRGQSLTINGLSALDSSQVQAVADSGLALGRGFDKRIVLVQHTYTIQPLTATVRLNEGDAQPLNQWLANHLFPEENYFRQELRQKLVLVSDDVFKYLVKFHMDVHTGNRIDPKKGVVDEGKLFTTEYLPHYSVMSGWAEMWPEFKADSPRTAQELMQTFKNILQQELKNYVQVGGKASIGKGIGRMVLFT